MAIAQENDRVIVFEAQGDATLRSLYLRFVRWVGSDKVAGDTLILKDKNGDIIAHSVCAVNMADAEIKFEQCAYFTEGITVDTLTSNHGVVYAYYE